MLLLSLVQVLCSAASLTPLTPLRLSAADLGSDVYDDICDQIEGKENGSYVVLSKFDDDVIFEYHITVMDDEFNLGVLTMRTPEGVFEADFDQ